MPGEGRRDEARGKAGNVRREWRRPLGFVERAETIAWLADGYEWAGFANREKPRTSPKAPGCRTRSLIVRRESPPLPPGKEKHENIVFHPKFL
jgi:hypothetical protein